MSQTPKEYEEIENFLALARTVDIFKNCKNIYELFGITETGATYAAIEVSINEFVGKYQAAAHVPKFKTFFVELQKNVNMIKRVLDDKVRDEYNKYLNDKYFKIVIEKMKGHFDFITNNGTLSSDDEDKLIESGKIDGLDEDECERLIDRWMKENGVTKNDSTSSTSSSSPFDKLLGLTFYEILGVPESANQAQIEEKYKEKYRENRKICDKKRADGEWGIITAAYNRLRDPAERIKYDREIHNPPHPPPDTPVLQVVRYPKYVFKNVKKGTSETTRIVIKNSGGGLLQGTITSDASWLEPDRNKLFDIHEQELYVNILTSKIPTRTYKVAGNVTIDTNAGKEIIPFKVFLESYDDELLRLKQYYVPMLAAFGGLIFSFHYDMLGFIIAGISLWVIGIIAAKPLLNLTLNKKIYLGKIPTPTVRAISIGIIVFTVLLQFANTKQPSKTSPVSQKNSKKVLTSKTGNKNKNIHMDKNRNNHEDVKIIPFDINSKFVDNNTKIGKYFIITGKVKNEYPTARASIQVIGRLYNKDSALVKEEIVFCGNILSDVDLGNTDLVTIQKRLHNRSGDNGTNLKVASGEVISFMIIFSNLPDNLSKFELVVKDSPYMPGGTETQVRENLPPLTKTPSDRSVNRTASGNIWPITPVSPAVPVIKPHAKPDAVIVQKPKPDDSSFGDGSAPSDTGIIKPGAPAGGEVMQPLKPKADDQHFGSGVGAPGTGIKPSGKLQ